MSNENEQITSITANSIEKDPKRVTAGKRLAEYINKNVREIL